MGLMTPTNAAVALRIDCGVNRLRAVTSLLLPRRITSVADMSSIHDYQNPGSAPMVIVGGGLPRSKTR